MRCLHKDPRRRYQTGLDVRNELEKLKAEWSLGEVQEGTPGHSDAPKTGWLRISQALRAGREVPLHRSIYAWLEVTEIAFMEGRSASDFIREAIEQYLERKRST